MSGGYSLLWALKLSCLDLRYFLSGIYEEMRAKLLICIKVVLVLVDKWAVNSLTCSGPEPRLKACEAQKGIFISGQDIA